MIISSVIHNSTGYRLQTKPDITYLPCRYHRSADMCFRPGACNRIRLERIIVKTWYRLHLYKFAYFEKTRIPIPNCQIYDRVAFCNKLLIAGSPFEQHDVWNTEVTGPMGSPSQLLFIYLLSLPLLPHWLGKSNRLFFCWPTYYTALVELAANPRAKTT